MYVLTDTLTGGIYAVSAANLKKSVTVFEERDDAVRYINLLEADGYEDTLEIIEVDKNVIAINCNTYGYNYSIIKKDDLIIPLQ